MELWGIVLGLCIDAIFYISVILYREIKYMMPSILKKYKKNKCKLRHFLNRLIHNKMSYVKFF